MPTSLGPAEILVILVVALIVLGPGRLPEAGRQVGKALAEIRRWSTDIKSEIKGAIDITDPNPSKVVESVAVTTDTAVATQAEPPLASEPVVAATEVGGEPAPSTEPSPQELDPAVALALARAAAEPQPGESDPESTVVMATVAVRSPSEPNPPESPHASGGESEPKSQIPESQSGDPSRPQG